MAYSLKQIDPVPQGLPLIDVGGLRHGDLATKRRIAQAMGAAARDIGFFRICNHGIDPELIEASYQMAARFFALPDAEKRRYYIGDSPNHRGYVPFTEKGDYADEVHRNYEAFDMGLDLPRTIRIFWPETLCLARMSGPNLPGSGKPCRAIIPKSRRLAGRSAPRWNNSCGCRPDRSPAR